MTDKGESPVCTCGYPTFKARNVTGHHFDCPMHQVVLEQIKEKCRETNKRTEDGT